MGKILLNVSYWNDKWLSSWMDGLIDGWMDGWIMTQAASFLHLFPPFPPLHYLPFWNPTFEHILCVIHHSALFYHLHDYPLSYDVFKSHTGCFSFSFLLLIFRKEPVSNDFSHSANPFYSMSFQRQPFHLPCPVYHQLPLCSGGSLSLRFTGNWAHTHVNVFLSSVAMSQGHTDIHNCTHIWLQMYTHA